MGVTIRRRHADVERLQALARANPGRIEVLGVEGDPPATVRFRLNMRSAVEMPAGGEPVIGQRHTLRVQFGQRYPLEPPLVYVESPVANPHVFPTTRRICIGVAWMPAETLDLFVQRVWAILAWDPQVIDPGSPANMAALDWSQAHKDRLPFEPTRLRGADAAPAPAEPAKPKISWRG
jgi:ubiquitin-protein ligase